MYTYICQLFLGSFLKIENSKTSPNEIPDSQKDVDSL